MTERAKLYSGALLLVSACSIAAGCAGRPPGRVSGAYDHASRELLRLDHDYDGDGRIDARVYIRNGRPSRLEADADADGLVERREIYVRGVLARTELDANGDGLIDRWEEYLHGAVVRLMLDDERRHGRPTRRIVYGAAGSARIETDLDGDGEWEPGAAR